MNLKRVIISVFFLVAWSDSFADLDTEMLKSEHGKACFESTLDYYIFRHYEYSKPPAPGSKEDKLGLPAAEEACKHGPARFKSIALNVDIVQDKDNYAIILDASRSTVPSGKIVFSWDSTENPFSHASKISIPSMVRSGRMNLIIRDPICRLEKTEMIKFKAS